MEKLLKNETSTGEMVTISRAEYEALLAKSAEQDQKIAWLMQQLRLDKKKLLGSSSEKTQEWVMEQLSLLFNEAEAYMPAEEPKTAVAAHIRRKHSGSVEEILPENVPVDVVEHRMPEEERICPVHGRIEQGVLL